MRKVYLISFVAALGLVGTAIVALAKSIQPDVDGQKISIPFFASEHGNLIPSVTRSDVEVLDNKAPQHLLAIQGRRELPLLLGVLIDNSGSQKSNRMYTPAVQTASDFTSRILTEPGDRAFFERFADAPDATPVMSKAEFLSVRIGVDPKGGTALFDAVRFACDERMRGDGAQESLRVIILITDGEDTHSRSSLDQAVQSALRAGVVIFAVDTADRHFPQPGPPWDMTLTELTGETGGTAFMRLSARSSVEEAFGTIKEQIGNMQLLSYIATNHDTTSRRHSIKLRSTSKPGLKLRAPKGITAEQTRLGRFDHRAVPPRAYRQRSLTFASIPCRSLL